MLNRRTRTDGLLHALCHLHKCVQPPLPPLQPLDFAAARHYIPHRVPTAPDPLPPLLYPNGRLARGNVVQGTALVATVTYTGGRGGGGGGQKPKKSLRT